MNILQHKIFCDNQAKKTFEKLLILHSNRSSFFLSLSVICTNLFSKNQNNFCQRLISLLHCSDTRAHLYQCCRSGSKSPNQFALSGSEYFPRIRIWNRTLLHFLTPPHSHLTLSIPPQKIFLLVVNQIITHNKFCKIL